MEKEIWKDIKGYEGLYQVSNLGRVRNLDKEVNSSNGRTTYVRRGRIIEGSMGKDYKIVGLTKLGKRKTFYFHKLVAIEFLGHVPCGYDKIVDHIDGDKLNNNVNNLQITTQRLNMSRRGGSSKYVGVYWYKRTRRWKAQIVFNGKKIGLGYFTNEIDAHNAYQKKLKEII